MRNAELYTFDGVVFPSTDPFPFEAVYKYFREDPLTYSPDPITDVPRIPDETYVMSPKQAVAFAARGLCTVGAGMWQYFWGRDADVYGNIGRPNSRPWIDLTEYTLQTGHIRGAFQEIYYRPKDVSGLVSKGEVVRRLSRTYDSVTHYDNNPWIIFGLARLFPQVHFVLVQNLNSGIVYSQQQIRDFPNVSIESRFAQRNQIVADVVNDGARVHHVSDDMRSFFEIHQSQLADAD